MIYLFNMLIISLFCAGLKIATHPGMILHRISMSWDELTMINGAQSWIYTVTLGCVYCYASFWGSILYWVLTLYVWGGNWDSSLLIMWPITCICCIYLNGLLYLILQKYESE